VGEPPKEQVREQPGDLAPVLCGYEEGSGCGGSWGNGTSPPSDTALTRANALVSAVFGGGAER